MSGYIGPSPVPQATQTRETFTATASQTSFATAGYTVGYLDVFLNGVKLVSGDDYTATNGSDVVLTTGAAANDVLEVVAYRPFEVVNQSFTGDFSVDSPTFVVDSTNNRVGIGTSSPTSTVNVVYDSGTTNEWTNAGQGLTIQNTSTAKPASLKLVNAAVGQQIVWGGTAGDSYLAFNNYNTERMRIDSSGNVGIGTSSPGAALDVDLGASTALTQPVDGLLIRDTVSGGDFDALTFLNSGTANDSDIRVFFESRTGTAINNGSIEFNVPSTNNPQLDFTLENSTIMSLHHTGNVLVGTTASPANGSGGVEIDPIGFMRTSRAGTTAKTHFVFDNNNGTVGTISTSGTTTSYNTSSDERLKENIADAQPASDLIDGIQVREFDWKADGEHQRYGMVAQELETVAPEAVTKGETEDDMWSVDYSKLVPMLTAALQESMAKIQALEARVTELETN